MSLVKLGVLGSGKGSNFAAIAQAVAAGTLAAEVAVVVSDRSDAGILKLAEVFGVPARALPASKYRTKLEPELEGELVRMLREAEVDLVVLAGYMRMIKEPMLEAFPDRIVNIHPSLLPKFRGLQAWKQALEAGVSVTGCTVHWVDAGMDTGGILGQREVPILPGDTAESLHARIQGAEHGLYPEVLARLVTEYSSRR